MFPARAGFTSMQIFGDSVSTTTNNTSGVPHYYGLRFTNGRVWVEVLAEQQGLNYEPDKNWSYFGHYSANLTANIESFSAPSDATSALFVVWVCNADLYSAAVSGTGTNLATGTSTIDQSQTNHFKAITNLFFAKGARTLVMPNGVDVSPAQFFSI